MLRPQNNDDRPGAIPKPVTNAGDARPNRLAEEYHRLAGEFAFHPAVNILPVSGDPPEMYQVEFRVRTVTLDSADRKLHYVDSVALVLTLDGDYPLSPPTVHPPEGLFLPNCDGERVQIGGAWQSGDWLVDLIPKLGELLACRAHDPDSVLNQDALEWQEANVAILPTDKSADFSAAAGGTPAQRIARHAAARVAEVRRVLESAGARLAEGQIDPDAIRDTAAQAKYVLLPLLGDGADSAIAASAKALAVWAEALSANLPDWYALRERRARLAAAQRAIDAMAAACIPLNEALAAMSAIFTGAPAKKPTKALGQIPLAEVLAPLVGRLSAALAEAVKQEDHARKALAEFADFDISSSPVTPPSLPSPASPAAATPVAGDSPLAKALIDRQASVSADCEKLAARAGPALEQMAELLRHARAENAALRRIADWREYLDHFTLGSTLARQAIEHGPAGAQAFVLESFGKPYGPYQFEQAVTFGNMQLAIGRDGEKLQVIDSGTGEIVGSRAALAISLKLPANGGEATLTVRATPDCAITATRLDACRQSTFDTLSRLHEFVPEAQSWCGKLLMVLCDPAALAALHAEHRRSAHRWDRLAEDLLLLAPLKDRLATFFLVKRTAAAASAMAQKHTAASQKLAASNEKLATLAARCGRDPNTDKLLIPAELAKPYSQATADRQSATKELHRIERRRVAMAEHVGKRLLDPARIGRAEIPPFRRLGALPPELAEMAESASDSALSDAVMSLGDQLGTQFPPIVASDPVDLTGRRREKRPETASAAADEALAARPEDSIADAIVVAEEE